MISLGVNDLPGAWLALYPNDKLADFDGHYWEVAWGPMFEFNHNGNMKFSKSS